MRVCIVSGSDSKGGAAKLAGRLVTGLRLKGVETTFLVRRQDNPEIESTQIVTCEKKLLNRIHKKLNHRAGLNHLALESPFPKHCVGVDFREFDIVHLHDIDAFNFRHLPWLGLRTKLFWTIHSMLPLTGNCVFSFDCERWKTTCGSCPQFGKWPLKWLHTDASDKVLKFKRNIYEKTRLNLIAVSNWISNQIRDSVLTTSPVTTIQNCVDVGVFLPVQKAKAKRRLGIEPNEKTIAFSIAANPEDRRKGIDIILEAIPKLKTKVTLMPMSIGAVTDDLMRAIGKDQRMLKPRHLDTDIDLQTYYSAADLIWHPSRADTSSLVSMEGMSCGTPVIAANVGGVPEVVGSPENHNPNSACGVLIPPDDSNALAIETDCLFANPETLITMGRSARQRAESKFNMQRFIDDHLSAYDV